MLATRIFAYAVFVIVLGYGSIAIAADKVVIGIGEIKSSIRGADPHSFQTMLETQLTKTNKFTVVERDRLVQILKEQGLSVSGLASGVDEFGGVTGVDYLIYGSITKFGEAKSVNVFTGVATGKSTYEMGVDLRIVDSATGEIITAETVDRKIKSGSAVVIPGFALGKSSGDPRADIQRLTAQDITGLIVTTIYPVKVAAVQGDGTVILTYGNSIFSDGDYVRLFEMGEGFEDPDTGELLGAEEIEIAILEITSALAKFSKARVVSGHAHKGAMARKMTPREVKKYSKGKKKKKKRL